MSKKYDVIKIFGGHLVNEEILKELRKMNTNQEDMIDIMMETLNIKLEKRKKKKD